MQRSLFYFALLLSVTLCGAQAQDKSDRPLITVSGQAEINVTPDMAVFNLRVVTLDKVLAQAKALNDERVKRVLALARDYQLAPQDVQTNYISIETRYSDDANDSKPPIFLGYEVSKSILLTLRDMTRIEALLSDVVKAGVNRVGGIAFRTTQLRKHRDQARQMAIKAAQEKATALAREIGQTIGKAYSITEESFERSSSSNNFSQNISSESGDYSESEGTIAIGQIPISARVTVSFELK